MHKNSLVKLFTNKINRRKLKIGVIGLGYVGLPLLYAFSKNKRVKVFGFDNDKSKIKKLVSGKSYINYFKKENINEMIRNKAQFTYNFSRIKKVDIIILCLPTPLKKNKTPDMSYINNFLKQNLKYFQKNQAISLESTTYPGTSREIVLPYILKRNFIPGQDFAIIYSPEREDPGNKKFNLSKIPKVVGGLTKNCKDIGSKIYSLLNIKIIQTSSIEIAEFTKILENVYRSVNIGLVNELKMLCSKMNIDIFEIINAAKTKPFGFQAFYPGPGYGGHCIPIDPFLLSWVAKRYNFETKFIKLSGKINSRIISSIEKKIIKIVNKKSAKILILGVAYKKNVDDYRESPALVLMNKLSQRKINFDYYDPYVKMINNSRSLKKISKIKSIKLIYKNISSYNLVVLITDHDLVNYSKLQKYSKLILDSRGVYKYGQFRNVISI
tara:strand:- start:296 stop:1612 length:1317 start_codon:yes stop_codon:yes gene_type:complete